MAPAAAVANTGDLLLRVCTFYHNGAEFQHLDLTQERGMLRMTHAQVDGYACRDQVLPAWMEASRRQWLTEVKSPAIGKISM